MLQKEFEERIGRSVSEQEYLEANAMYENAGDMNKDEFCREWLKIGSCRLVKCLAEKTYQLGKALSEQKLLHQGTTEKITELIDRQALWLIGAKEVVLRKIKMDMDLSEMDKNYINRHLI